MRTRLISTEVVKHPDPRPLALNGRKEEMIKSLLGAI
jgi:hypothetical protein